MTLVNCVVLCHNSNRSILPWKNYVHWTSWYWNFIRICLIVALLLNSRPPTSKLKMLLVESLVFSHLYYCLPVWGPPLTQQLLQRRLERMQNRAVRLCKRLSKFDQVSEHYRQLKWLPLRELIQLHSVRLMYCQYHRTKCIPLMPPIEFGPCQSRYDTRTAAHFANLKRFRLTFSQNFFRFTASQWWNSLPISLHCIIKDKCLKKFYNGYNAYLFSHMYND